MKSYYKDKIVYITGGSTGIGLKLAEKLFFYGAHVVIFSRKEPKLKSAVKIIESLRINEHQKLDAFSLDVSDERAVKNVMKAAVKKAGPPDIVISNAGVPSSSLFENMSYKEFDYVMQVNLYGSRNVSSALIPHLKKKRGQLAFVASGAGIMPMYSYSAYGTSKYAVVGFAEILRSELVHEGVAVSVICPPEIDTPLIREEAKTMTPLARAVKNSVGLMDIEGAADAMLKGIKKKRFMIIPGFRLRFFFFLHRVTNGWLTRFVSDLIVKIARYRIRRKNK